MRTQIEIKNVSLIKSLYVLFCPKWPLGEQTSKQRLVNFLKRFHFSDIRFQINWIRVILSLAHRSIQFFFLFPFFSVALQKGPPSFNNNKKRKQVLQPFLIYSVIASTGGTCKKSPRPLCWLTSRSSWCLHCETREQRSIDRLFEFVWADWQVWTWSGRTRVWKDAGYAWKPTFTTSLQVSSFIRPLPCFIWSLVMHLLLNIFSCITQCSIIWEPSFRLITCIRLPAVRSWLFARGFAHHRSVLRFEAGHDILIHISLCTLQCNHLRRHTVRKCLCRVRSIWSNTLRSGQVQGHIPNDVPSFRLLTQLFSTMLRISFKSNWHFD